jgi:hypothetical protein
MSEIQNKDKLFLAYADLQRNLNESSVDLEKLCIKGNITSARDLRRFLREMKQITTKAIDITKKIEAENREIKKG